MLSKKAIIILGFMVLSLIIGGCSQISDSQDSQDENDWEVSPTFFIPYTGKDGNEYEYILHGEEGKIGFIDGVNNKDFDEDFDTYLIAGEKNENKYMWHLWGDEDKLKRGQRFEVISTHKETGEELNMVRTTLGSPHNGAQSVAPTQMMFPKEGLWRLDAYVNDELFGNVVINVLSSDIKE